MNRILVTGFRPFLGERINPSEILLEWIKKDFTVSYPVQTLLLPVSFANASVELENKLAEGSVDIVLMLGQAGGRTKISLERVALNWIETEKPDEDGITPKQGKIDSQETAATALFSSLPLTEWKEHLTQRNLPVEISLSAGGYVCNHVYYKTLQAIYKKHVSMQACFIHVPYLPEQAVNKPGMPTMELTVMQETLSQILQLSSKKK
ncbi:pyroglutamyl-peptidase I [Bdellovibrio bacteriovorus]|uniref:pyroglutamyl-peptidase I family protein n=1 Tax=Bdellovibrio bacteriovorus TaxID=959 RepID=UPI0035A5A81F